MRHKATHFFNVPHYANKVFEFFIALLNTKLKNRIMVSEKCMKSNPFNWKNFKHYIDNYLIIIRYIEL
jgi:hypothetical protein